MSFVVNHCSVTAAYDSHVFSSSISPLFLSQSLRLPSSPGHHVQLPLSMSSLHGSFIFATTHQFTVAPSHQGVDIVLGTDWYSSVSSVFAGQSLRFINTDITFPAQLRTHETYPHQYPLHYSSSSHPYSGSSQYSPLPSTSSSQISPFSWSPHPFAPHMPHQSTSSSPWASSPISPFSWSPYPVAAHIPSDTISSSRSAPAGPHTMPTHAGSQPLPSHAGFPYHPATISQPTVSLSPSTAADHQTSLYSSAPSNSFSVSTQPTSLPPSPISTSSIQHILDSFEGLLKNDLVALAMHHGIPLHSNESLNSKESIRAAFTEHLFLGLCLTSTSPPCPGCTHVTIQLREEMQHPDGAADLSSSDVHIYLLSTCPDSMGKKTLRRLLNVLDIQYELGDSISHLRKLAKQHVSSLRKNKKYAQHLRAVKDNHAAAQQRAEDKETARKTQIAQDWPQLVPSSVKESLLEAFKLETSSAALAEFTCASCAASYNCSEKKTADLDSIDLTPLKATPASHPHHPPVAFTDVRGQSLLIETSGIFSDDAGAEHVALCSECFRCLKKQKLPPLSLANFNYLGPVPEELKDLTIVEEAMIARCRAKCWVVQLKEEKSGLRLSSTQRGMKGHIIIYPQNPSAIAKVLPPSIDEIITPVCVIFVGSSPPTPEWLKKHAKPLCVRREKVRNALHWLKANNRLYYDITLNETVLNSLEDEQILPFHVQHVLPSDSSDGLTSRYDAIDELVQKSTGSENAASSSQNTTANSPSAVNSSSDNPESVFQSVVITDVDAHAPSHELRAAAMRHVKYKGGGYIKVSHEPTPINEFNNPNLFPMIYPTLFPYGLGGAENRRRTVPLSLKANNKHYFNLTDRRFQEHYSFLFTVFNMLQRRAILLQTSLKVKRKNFADIASTFASVSPLAIHVVSQRIANGDSVTANNNEERKVLELMKQVKTVTTNVPGSAASKLNMRNEIRALNIDEGLPSFYLTINPADIYNPLVKFLAGTEIDIDNLLPEDVPKYHEQSVLIAKNPAVAAKFFNVYMKAFIKCILGYDAKKPTDDGGILGHVSAYYGCVEAQGRGTLHCHMLIWLEGSLNPNEIKDRVLRDGDKEFEQRLLLFLDDTISNSIPEDPATDVSPMSSTHHPCAVRFSVPPDTPQPVAEALSQKDLRNLVTQCQSHSHTDTCYKYCSKDGPKTCRFNLDECNVRPFSCFDEETGDICLRCLDGLVNNFNETIIRAVRCNMDLKFIGSGAAAKAMIYYVTDYITKSQLKTHVAFAALELAIQKLGEYDPKEDELTHRAKRLLQRCAYTMLSHQELSAQQVISYLMDYEDHFTSHKFRNLYWTSFERYIQKLDPSPECYTTKRPSSSDATEQTLHEAANTDAPVSANADNDNLEGQPSLDSDNDSDAGHSDDEDGDDEDEVTIAVDSATKKITSVSSQVENYIYRGAALKDLCLWDFVRRTDKLLKPTKKPTRLPVPPVETESNPSEIGDAEAVEEDVPVDDSEPLPFIVDSDGEEAEYEDDDDLENPDIIESDIDESEEYPKRADGHLKVPFLKTHQDAKTHHLSLRPAKKAFVAVPIGPALPRRDAELTPKYSRLMLMLFKPWYSPADLRNEGQSWPDAFREFQTIYTPDVQKKIDNMQILHECKDSRDDHFAKRLKERSTAGTNRERGRGRVNDDFVGPSLTEADIANHLESIENYSSNNTQRSQDNILECMHLAEESGMFASILPCSSDVERQDYHTKVIDIVAQPDVNPNAEDLWKRAYDERRDIWKKSSTAVHQEKPEM